MRKFSAYTLIEILVGISIIGLLFAVGYAGFRDFSRRQALNGAVKSVKGDLRLAQAEALSGKKEGCSTDFMGMSFDIISESAYTVVAKCVTGTPPQKNVTIPADLNISSDFDPVLFKVLGQGTNIPDDITVTITITQLSTGKTAVITIGHGGEII